MRMMLEVPRFVGVRFRYAESQEPFPDAACIADVAYVPGEPDEPQGNLRAAFAWECRIWLVRPTSTQGQGGRHRAALQAPGRAASETQGQEEGIMSLPSACLRGTLMAFLASVGLWWLGWSIVKRLEDALTAAVEAMSRP
jgi:hypothetical protein